MHIVSFIFQLFSLYPFSKYRTTQTANNQYCIDKIEYITMEVKFRDYERGDEGAVFQIVRDVLATYGLHTNPAVTDRDLSDIAESYIRPGGVFRIVEVDGEIAGSYGLYPLSAKVCELRKMYLMPIYQGRGIGKMMMDEALALAREKGFEEIVLETNSVLVRATHLYRKYNFEYYEPVHLSDRCDSAMRLGL